MGSSKALICRGQDGPRQSSTLGETKRWLNRFNTMLVLVVVRGEGRERSALSQRACPHKRELHSESKS